MRDSVQRSAQGSAARPVRVMFVCHGNICRSPMAEFLLKGMVEKRGIADHFAIESAATTSEELGNPVYPGTRKRLAEEGISVEGKTAKRLRSAGWTRRICAIWGAYSEAIRTAKSTRCSNSQVLSAMWPIRGIQAILMPRTTISMPGASACYHGWVTDLFAACGSSIDWAAFGIYTFLCKIFTFAYNILHIVVLL